MTPTRSAIASPVPVLATLYRLLTWSAILLAPASVTLPQAIASESPRVKVAVGEFKTVSAPEDVVRIAVAAPDIADYTVISKREILVNGKKMGITSLNIWMKDKRLNYLVEVADPRQAKLERLSALEDKIEEINNNPNIKITYTDRGVVLSGKAKSEEEKKDVEKVIRAYMPDKDQEVTNVIEVWRRPRLVRMKVRILEIEEKSSRELGIDWGSITNVTSVTTGGGLFHDQFSAAGTFSPNVWPRMQAGFRRSQAMTMIDPFMVQVNALIESGVIRILAEPEVVALIGAASDVLIGGEIPIPVAQSNNTVTIEWKEHGIKMKLQPDIDDEERVSALISAEVSTLDFTNGLKLSNFTVPAIKITRATSKIHVKPGRTVFLSGLKRETDEKTTTSVPGFSSIPVMGEAFVNRTKNRKTVDLIISVTPFLVEEEEAGQNAR